MSRIYRIQVNDIRVQYREGGRDFDAEAVHKAASLINKKTGLNPQNLKISKKLYMHLLSFLPASYFPWPTAMQAFLPF